MEYFYQCRLDKEKGFGADIFIDSKHKKLSLKTMRYSAK